MPSTDGGMPHLPPGPPGSDIVFGPRDTMHGPVPRDRWTGATDPRDSLWGGRDHGIAQFEADGYDEA